MPHTDATCQLVQSGLNVLAGLITDNNEPKKEVPEKFPACDASGALTAETPIRTSGGRRTTKFEIKYAAKGQQWTVALEGDTETLGTVELKLDDHKLRSITSYKLLIVQALERSVADRCTIRIAVGETCDKDVPDPKLRGARTIMKVKELNITRIASVQSKRDEKPWRLLCADPKCGEIFTPDVHCKKHK
ncbi:hypothetical protein MKEN_01305800 [Mycena kentingensis (nom. inval.)]|nr:hypothetical protein MKEN_01305800 [Mycena kentingensis (nom. inval.)]